MEQKLGIGSGIILTSDGFILSNYQITGGRDETCFVTFRNGRTFPAEVKWADSNLDISIIKVAINNLLSLKMRDSNSIEIGDEYYILSNSIGYESSESLKEVLVSKPKTTLKIVEDNNIIYAEDIIKLDSNVEFNDNGGAMINNNGEILGIASSKINAVIPINRTKKILNKLIENENYQNGYLGIYGFDNSVLKNIIPEYSLKIGIFVEKIDEKSPVYKQIISGDVITKIDDYELSTFEELDEYLYEKVPKENVKLTIIRGKKEYILDVILKESPRLL